MRPGTPSWGLRATFVATLVCALALPVLAQPRKGDKGDKPAPAPTEKMEKADGKTAAKKPKEKTFDFNALDLNGRMRTPQLLYFLERANEELERASLEKRSFIPHMVRAVDEEAM
jgi:hypothetical protein